MAIRNSRYKINNGSGYDIIHFENNQHSVKVIDREKQEIGTLSELVFNGKKIESGGFLNIKNTGKYQIKNVQGLPSTINAKDWSMLIVDSVGEFGEPVITNYCLIGNDGVVYNNTIINGRDSGWSAVGKKIGDTVNIIQQNIGSLNSLQTSNKGSLVNALNEVLSGEKETRNSLNRHISDFNKFKTHNHDGVYIKSKDISELTSRIQVKNNAGIDIIKSSGETDRLIRLSEDTIGIGNKSTPINIYGKDVMLYNNKIVWTEDNDGEGSGMDADKLDGKHADDFAILRKNNEFTGTQTFSNIKVNKVNVGEVPIVYSNGVLKIGEYHRFGNGVETLNRTHLLAYNGAEAQVILRTSDGSGGIGLARPKETGDLHLYNWDINKPVMTVKNHSDVMEFYRNISISGRNLYLQDTQPNDSNIPVGSIWFS